MYINKLHKLLIDCNYLVSTDTRKITSKSIFFALKGKNFDGNEYALEALDTGASYVIVPFKNLVNLIDNNHQLKL